MGGSVLKKISMSFAAAVLVSVFNVSLPTVGWAEITEMVVTTRKRAENLQDVPISIVALTAEELQRQNVLNIADLALSTPGLSIEQQGGGGFATPVIRGMAQNVISTDLSYDNNVGIFVNGVYQSGRNSVDLELIGIDRIEVARGPQSALYGRSTFSGAINYVFAEPTDELQGDVSLLAGSDSDYGAKFDVGGPIWGDKLSGRVSAGYREFDGTFKNLAGGSNLQGYESFAGAAALVWTPVDRISATLNLLYSDRTNFQDAQFLVNLNCGTGGAFPPPGGAPTYYCGELKAQGDVDLSPEGKTDAEVTQASLKLEWETDVAVLTSLTSTTETEYRTLLDRDYGSVALGTGLTLTKCQMTGFFGCDNPLVVTGIDTAVQSFAHSGSDTDDFSQEFRIASINTERFTWMAGLFYYDSETSTDTNASLGSGTNPLGPGETYIGFGGPFAVSDPVTQSAPFNVFDANTEAWAVFGQASWSFTEQLTLTAEVRYTDEEKDTTISYNFAPIIPPANYKRSFDYTTPRITLDYKPTENLMLYASAAKGVRTGGINGGVTGCSPFATPEDCAAAQAAERFFEPEENWTYELGSKSLLWDNRLQLNAAIYTTDWKDTQLSALNADNFGTHVVNVDGGVDVWGIELDGVVQLGEMVTITAGYAYTDPEFKNGTYDGSVVTSCGVAGDLCTIGADSEGRVAADVSGQTLGRVAQNQLNVGLILAGALANSGWNWYAQTNALYQDGNHARSINSMTYGERTLVNLRLAVLNDSWEVAIWGKNIFDEEYVSSQALQPGFDGGRRIDAYQGNGARYGITGAYRF
jgi:iron complex outermembrane receptor protein